jgi:hypothetical protein
VITKTNAGRLRAEPSQSILRSACIADMSSGRGRKLGVRTSRIGVETAPMIRLM